MPKIRPFIGSGPTGANRLNVRMPAISMGEGFRAAGQAISQVAEAAEGEADRQNREEVSKKIAELQTESFKDLEQSKLTAEEDGTGFAKNSQETFQARRDKMAQEFSSAAAMRMFNSQSEQIGVNVFKHSFKHESGLKASHESTLVKESIQNEKNLVRTDPSKLKDTLTAREEAVRNNATLLPEVKTQLLQRVKNEYYDSALDGAVTSFLSRGDLTPSMVDKKIQEVSNKEWQEGASSQMYDSALSRLQQQKKRLDVQDKSDFKRAFKERMLNQRLTGQEQPFTEEMIRSKGFSKSETESLVEVLKYSKTIGQINKEMPHLSQADLMEKLSQKDYEKELKENPDKTNELVAERSALLNAMSARTKALKQDASKYSMDNNADIESKFQKFTNLAASDASPEEKNQAAQEYIDATSAYQRMVNPTEDPSLVPKSRGDFFADQVRRALDSEQGADKAYQLLVNEKQLWGDSWHLAMRDYKKHKSLTDTQFMAASISDKPSMAIEILNSQAVATKEIRDKLSRDAFMGVGTKYPDIVSEVESQLDDFFTSTSNSMSAQGHQEIKRMYTDVISRAAALRVIGGEDSDDAVEHFVKEFVNDRYTFSGDVRVPKSVATPNLEHGLRGYAQDLIENPENVVPPMRRFGVSEESARDRYYNNLISTGHWVNDHDRGARYVDGNGGQVFVKDKEGKEVPLIRSWDELEARGNETRGKNISPVRGF